MKCTTVQKAIERYGAIDFASKHWAMQSHWIIMYEVPEAMFPNWHVLDTKMPVKHIAVNRDMYDPLDAALKSLIKGGLADELHTFDGCLNIRPVRGTLHSPSCHSYGLALDLDAAMNPLGDPTSSFSSGFVKCFTDQGFNWGGNFHHRKDPMHFSYAWE